VCNGVIPVGDPRDRSCFGKVIGGEMGDIIGRAREYHIIGMLIMQEQCVTIGTLSYPTTAQGDPLQDRRVHESEA